MKQNNARSSDGWLPEWNGVPPVWHDSVGLLGQNSFLFQSPGWRWNSLAVPGATACLGKNIFLSLPGWEMFLCPFIFTAARFPACVSAGNHPKHRCIGSKSFLSIMSLFFRCFSGFPTLPGWEMFFCPSHSQQQVSPLSVPGDHPRHAVRGSGWVGAARVDAGAGHGHPELPVHRRLRDALLFPRRRRWLPGRGRDARLPGHPTSGRVFRRRHHTRRYVAAVSNRLL